MRVSGRHNQSRATGIEPYKIVIEPQEEHNFLFDVVGELDQKPWMINSLIYYGVSETNEWSLIYKDSESQG